MTPYRYAGARRWLERPADALEVGCATGIATGPMAQRGALAFWAATHVVPVDGDPFFSELQDVYDEIGESTPGDWVFPRPGEPADQAAEISATGLFEQVVVRQFDWETVHDADGYIALLGKFSGHRVMQSWQRQRLYGEIRRRLGRRPTGTVRRHWGAVLHVATRSP